MEQLKTIIEIDLSEYGKEGTIEMRAPSLRKQNEFKNAMGKYVRMTQNKEMSMSDNIPVGDLEIAMLMQYVFRAPFKADIEGFLSFTDGMEPFFANALMKRMNEAIVTIDESSPFVNSPSAETENSV